MPNLILIAGLPASGKSHFSKFAGEQLGYPVLEKDKYKEILFDNIGFKNRDEKLRLGLAATELMYQEAEDFLRLGFSVILDNNFENSSVPGVLRLMEKYNTNTVTFRFEGETEAIYKRFIQRDMSPTRHPGHISNTCYPCSDPRLNYFPISLESFSQKFHERGLFDFFPGGILIPVDVTTFRTYDPQHLLSKLKAVLI